MLKDEIDLRLQAALESSPAFADAFAGKAVDPDDRANAALIVISTLAEIVMEMGEEIEALRAEVQAQTEDQS